MAPVKWGNTHSSIIIAPNAPVSKVCRNQYSNPLKYLLLSQAIQRVPQPWWQGWTEAGLKSQTTRGWTSLHSRTPWTLHQKGTRLRVADTLTNSEASRLHFLLKQICFLSFLLKIKAMKWLQFLKFFFVFFLMEQKYTVFSSSSSGIKVWLQTYIPHSLPHRDALRPVNTAVPSRLPNSTWTTRRKSATA